MSLQINRLKKNFKKPAIPSVRILNVRVSSLAKAEILAWIGKWVESGEKKMVVTPNSEQVVLAQKDRSFRKILNSASLALCDGEGLVWASRFLGEKPLIPERVTGEEVMQELVNMAAKNGWKVFLLGGKLGVAEKTAKLLRIKNQELRIKASSGAVDIRRETDGERRQAIMEINSFEPDLLFVAYGAPWQEKWLAKNLEKLDIKVGMVVGGALDMIVDLTLRPPRFMTRLGLDWLYRLLRQPWRIKRQMALVKFAGLVLKRRLFPS